MQSGETRANLCVDLVTRETEALKLDEKAPVAEKLGAPEDAPQAEENKVSKDATANVEEEKEEEDKVYFML
jgi:plasminogen activator inhibitor 1 RNA-binding protein